MKNKKITINIRLDEALHSEMLEKANLYFRGNLSALIRCASVKYTDDTQSIGLSGTNVNIAAILDAIFKLVRKIGVNHNQLVRNVNEKMKLSPLAFQPSDLQPLVEFGYSLRTVEEMLRYLYNMLNS